MAQDPPVRPASNQNQNQKPAKPNVSLSENSAVPEPGPVRLDMKEGVHLYSGVRYGPGVVTLDPADFLGEDKQPSAEVFNRTVQALFNSVQNKANRDNVRRLIIKKESKGAIKNAAPSPIQNEVTEDDEDDE